jgi:MFS family permease
MPAASRPLVSAARTAWITLAVLSAINLLNYLDRYIMSAVLTPLQRDLRLGDGAAAWAGSAFMLGYFISAPFFGYLGDRYPRRYLMLGGVLVWSLATACSGLAQNFGQLFAIRLFVGFGEACFVAIGPSWISDLFAVPRRNTAITLFYVAIPFGSAIGYIIGGWFAQRGDWRGAFIYTGLPGLLLALSLLLLREPRRGEADGVAERATDPTTLNFREIFGLFRNTRYNLLVWGYTAQTFAVGAFAFWGPAFLHRVHAYSLGAASTIFGAMLAGAGLAATLIGGLTATRLRRYNPAGYVWVMAFSLLATLPLCTFAFLTRDATWSVTALGASMFFLFLPTGPVTSELLEIVPVHLRASGVALSIFLTHLFGDLGSPTVVGSISDAVNDLQKAVLILPPMLLIGAGLWCALIYFTRQPAPVIP